MARPTQSLSPIGWLLAPADEYRIASAWFLKAMALIYFAAFASLAVQIEGLAGSQGILPFSAALDHFHGTTGSAAYWRVPNIFWLNSSDLALTGASLAGCVLAVLLLFGRIPRLSLVLLFVLYLSLFHAGQIFFNFQWDYLLLEAGFLSILLSLNASRLVIWLFHWLLFRLRFESGIAKLLSGDESWSGLSALKYYFETQPLPHWGAWYAHHLPDWVLRSGAGLVLFAELLVPLLLFLPRRFKIFAGSVTLVTQFLIIATSNHNWFNLLTIALCLFLFDDQALRRLWPWKSGSLGTGGVRPSPSHFGSWLSLISGSVILVASTALLVEMAISRPVPEPLNAAIDRVRAFGLTQRYHVFPTINRQRYEVEIQGSLDGVQWTPYLFRYKPGDPSQRPEIIIPDQPRLDWMMWFVTLSLPMNARWLEGLVHRLFENSPAVTGLLRANPFAEKPPKYIRAEVFRYRFTTPEEREASGDWWVREAAGPLIPMPWVNPAALGVSRDGPAVSAPRPPPPGQTPP